MNGRWTAPLVAVGFTCATIVAFSAAARLHPQLPGVWGIASATISTSSVILLAAWAASRMWNVPLRVRKVSSVASALIAVAWLASASVTVDAVTTQLGFTTAAESTVVMLRSASTPRFLFVAVAIAILPAISEEALFRGAIGLYVEREAGVVVSFVTTSILFGAIHLSPYQGVQAALLGLVLHAIARREGLSVAILAHATNNFAFAWVARINVAPSTTWTIVFGSLIFGALSFVYLHRRTSPG